jgi:hypothetical protein
MKISHVTTRILSTPADNPLVVGLPIRGDTREQLPVAPAPGIAFSESAIRQYQVA